MELRNDLIKIAFPFVLTGISVLCADYYTDRKLEDKNKEVDYYKDYTKELDSLMKVNKQLREEQANKEVATIYEIRKMINKGEELTSLAIDIAIDTTFELDKKQRDSIYFKMLSE